MPLPMSNSFEPLYKIHPYFIEVIKVNENKYDYITNRHSLVWDSVGDLLFTDIKEKGKRQTIPIPLDNSNSKYHIYLEASFNDSYQINSITYRGSTTLLPLIDGTDGAEGFVQSSARVLIGTIGQNGSVCQNHNSLLMTKLGILNGSPVCYFKNQAYIYYGF